MTACSIQVRGVVQGVGFRPFVYRLAHENALAGWVLNQASGVDIQIEGNEAALECFMRALTLETPPAALITSVDVQPAEPAGLRGFTIRETRSQESPVTRISPDLPVCEDCLAEMRDATNPRFGYPYINCTNCGPRYSLLNSLPYDRDRTTMRNWRMDALCESQYRNPSDRRFHAQPIACAQCGPAYELDDVRENAIARAAALLGEGRILAIKGIGGYHLACDARNATAVSTLRNRKFRKEKPFAVMAADCDTAAALVELSPDSQSLIESAARPIVLAPGRVELKHVAPEQCDLGVMLPYAPLHHLLFDAGAPDVLVLTSANRSNEAIAFRDDEARERLQGIADSFLTGEREIARRVDDSVARAGVFGPMILRRSRGYAPGAVAVIPTKRPILALGADLKNSVTLVAEGQAFVSQHIGDLGDYECQRAFRETVQDLSMMYRVDPEMLTVAHDLHPQYVSTLYAQQLAVKRRITVQHHRAHIASVLAEKHAWDTPVIGVSFDGTGYGDDGTIWGGEFFHGSIEQGFERVMHLRTARLPGGDAAARYPVQSAAGFLESLPCLPDLCAAPFSFPERYHRATELLERDVRVFTTTSMGRLFDCAAALVGFTRETTYEGQAAIWLEQLARRSATETVYPFPICAGMLDYVPLLQALVEDRLRGRDRCEIARAFQCGVAQGIHRAAGVLCEKYSVDVVVLSGGVFQNELLLHDLSFLFSRSKLRVWTNSAVPPNDGGISLGQAAIAAFTPEAHSNA